MQSSSHPLAQGQTLNSPSSRISSRAVAIWVYTGAFMLIIQVVLGGITRLTGSGLSITEWDVVTGAMPPLNHAQWMQAFEGYKHTGQFRILNSDFSLADYKNIFFWEWFHRLWARLVGVIFIIGFIWFLVKRRLNRWMIGQLALLFLVGALQGTVGWIMVASGFVGDALYVAPTKLALHFIFALGLIVYTFWFALQLSVPVSQRLTAQAAPSRQIKTLRRWSAFVLVLLFIQLLYGALMAGNKAATVAPTWPDINGSWLPASAFTEHPLLHDLAGNKLTVHFIHRTLAYCLFIAIVIWTVLAVRISPISGYFRRLRWLPMGVVTLQIILGICSLLASPGIVPHHWGAFEWLAQLHQITGLVFLLTIVGMLYLVVPVKNPTGRSPVLTS
jgi:cytochrome c oxidase assembly protein subunit 15